MGAAGKWVPGWFDATWLADQVGPSGHVLATDLDVTWIPSPDITNITIARHDVVRDPIPEGEYDLVHARLVLDAPC